MSEEELWTAVEKLIGHVVAIQARCDAAETMLRVLAKQAGADPEKFEDALQTVRATCAQRRLETIENLSPRSAARLDWRDDAGPVDFDLLKKLRPGPKG